MRPRRYFLLIVIVIVLVVFSTPRWSEWIDGLADKGRLGESSHANQVKEISREFLCIPSPLGYEVGVVTRVIDGDSILVDVADQKVEVRYIGIDAPEMTGQNSLAGQASKEANQAWVLGKQVLMFKDVSETDRFGRLLRYVFVEAEFINYLMVRNGYAVAKSYPPDVACQNVLSGAYQGD